MPPKGFKYSAAQKKAATSRRKSKVFVEDNGPVQVKSSRSAEDQALRLSCLHTVCDRFPPDSASVDLLIERAIKLFEFVKGNTTFTTEQIVRSIQKSPDPTPAVSEEALLDHAPKRSLFDPNVL